MSGGGSALAALPAEGVDLAQKQAITRALLQGGAPIAEVNVVRRHLSAIKGGRLALAAQPARVVTLAISDIPGDDASLVASGPTAADPSTCADALEILDRYGIPLEAGLRHKLACGVLETPKPMQLAHVEPVHVVASAALGLQAAAQHARQAGWAAYVLSDAIEGEARTVASMHAAIALQVARKGQPFRPPCVLLSGGEATVTVQGNGQGGRNTEFALALLGALRGEAGVWGLSVGTDGLDGSAGAAGAWISPLLWGRAREMGLAFQVFSQRNDSAGFLGRLGALVHTGPTHTNINDFRALLVKPHAVSGSP
jgi:glycerate 2-kinase